MTGAGRAALAWACAAALSCTEGQGGAAKPKPPAPPRAGLKVRLPDGWVATPDGARLKIGPASGAVALLESSPHPAESLEALAAVVEAEGAEVLEKESDGPDWWLRYRVSGREGALAGHGTVRCASLPGAPAEALAAIRNVCAMVEFKGP